MEIPTNNRQTANYDQSNAKPNGMSTASLILGICSILLLFFGMGFFFGALGITFAVLSRGHKKMNTNARIGLGLSIGSIILTLALFIGFLTMFIPAVQSAAQTIEQGNYDLNNEEDINRFVEDIMGNYIVE